MGNYTFQGILSFTNSISSRWRRHGVYPTFARGRYWNWYRGEGRGVAPPPDLRYRLTLRARHVCPPHIFWPGDAPVSSDYIRRSVVMIPDSAALHVPMQTWRVSRYRRCWRTWCSSRIRAARTAPWSPTPAGTAISSSSPTRTSTPPRRYARPSAVTSTARGDQTSPTAIVCQQFSSSVHEQCFVLCSLYMDVSLPVLE